MWILVVLILIGPMLLTANAASSDAATQQASSILDVIEKLLKSAAYIVGGLWVYFNYFRGRTYKPRLEITITGATLKQHSSSYIKLNVHIKNVGLSKVDIKQRGTALRLSVYDAKEAKDPWKHRETISILENHQWIEPGEPIDEPTLLKLPPHIAAVRVEVIVVSTSTMWETAAIFSGREEEKHAAEEA